MLQVILFLVGLEVNSKVDSVVVYSDRVLVARTAFVNLERTTDLVFSGLPGGIDDQSVRIKAPGLVVGEIQIVRGYRKEPPARIKELETKVKLLEIEDRTLSDETVVMQAKEALLNSIAAATSSIASKELYTGKVAPQSWQMGVKYVVDELMRTKVRIAEIERQKADLKDKLDALRQELDNTRSYEENRKTISFDATPKNDQNFRIELDYVVWGANWYTYYDFRADPSAKEINISYFGKVNQRTGEDWDNTKIVLSTGKPALGGAAPTPQPWYVNIYEPRYKDEEARRGRADEVTLAPAAKAVLAQPTEAPPATPPDEAGIAIWYPLPGRHTIKSGDPERKILIKETAIDAEFDYFTMPRVTQLAYSMGRMKNTTDYLFLAGQGGTYVGDDYTGRTYVGNIAPDDSAAVSFGVDERVKIKRETKKMKISKGGAFGGKKKYEFVYESTIENFHSKDIKCEIVDQIPLPGHQDIKVGGVELKPKPTEEDKDRGVYTWIVSIPAKGQYKISSSFTVEAPAEAEIEGLMP